MPVRRETSVFQSLKARSPSISENADLADNRYLEPSEGSECYAEIGIDEMVESNRFQYRR